LKINLKTCTEEELWKYVAIELAKNGVDVILVGGAVVSIYSEGAYRSGDLDFVLNDFSRQKLDEVLTNLGFNKSGRFKEISIVKIFSTTILKRMHLMKKLFAEVALDFVAV